MNEDQARPFDVGERFPGRRELPELVREDFIRSEGQSSSHPLLFVRISNVDFADGRPGYDPRNPPDEDAKILERMDKWWQLGPHLKAWVVDPSTSPRTLVAVSGSPGSQIVIGSVLIDPEGWPNALRNGAFYRVPTRGPHDLDAFNFRERRISRAANIKFGPNTNQIFLILESSGRIIGGRPSIKG